VNINAGTPPLARAGKKKMKGGKVVCHTVTLPFTFESILRQKKIYGNSNISPCNNIIFKKKSSRRNQNSSR